MADLPFTVAVLSERTMAEFHFSWETLLVSNGSSPTYQGGWQRALIHGMVVRHNTQIEVGVGWLPVQNVTQGAIRSSIYINVQKGKVAICLSLANFMFGMYDVEVVFVVHEARTWTCQRNGTSRWARRPSRWVSVLQSLPWRWQSQVTAVGPWQLRPFVRRTDGWSIKTRRWGRRGKLWRESSICQLGSFKTIIIRTLVKSLKTSYNERTNRTEQKRNGRNELLEGGDGIQHNRWKKRNYDTRKELHARGFVTRIKYYQTKWWRHVERMEDKRIPKILFKYNPKSKTGQGRP